MDPIAVAIVAALGVEAISSFTETSKRALTEAYHELKDLLVKKIGTMSDEVQ